MTKSKLFLVKRIFSLLFLPCSLLAQPKILREINNDFIERKEDWKLQNKYNFFEKKDEMKASFGGEKLKLTNKKSSGFGGVDIAGEHRELFWTKYANGKLSVSISPGDGKSAGIYVKRFAGVNVSKGERSFTFVINEKGSIAINTYGKQGKNELYSFVTAPASFKPDSPSRLSIERIGMIWKFFLNDDFLYSYTDNSNGSFQNIRFITDGNSTSEFTQPSFIFYDYSVIEPFHRSTVNGKLCYTDNVAGFMVIEDELKACPFIDSKERSIRYQTKPCPGMIYTTEGEVGDMMIGIIEINIWNEDSTQRYLELRKEVGQRGGKSYSATIPNHYDFTGEKDTVHVNYIDEVYESNGKIITCRCFYYYNKDKFLFIDIRAYGNQSITENKFYQACMKSIVLKKL
ncbi:MAG: hypothetical protein IPO63_06385 [Bacteroidetes bacterium]|nr:hypothetical protein [Bacteroidota bacterium]